MRGLRNVGEEKNLGNLEEERLSRILSFKVEKNTWKGNIAHVCGLRPSGGMEYTPTEKMPF